MGFELNEKVLRIVKEKGPLLPVQVARELNIEILIASAVLSDLSSQKLIRLSHGKIGGSPLYYITGQEQKLQVLANYFKDALKKAFSILLERKLLREKECDAWLRVALRDIKDFAIPLTANINSSEEAFWKWYMLSDEEAENIVKEMISQKKEELKPELPETKKETREEHKRIEKPREEAKKPKEKKDVKKAEGEFAKKLSQFLSAKGITITEGKWLRNDKDYEAVVKIHSAAGELIYYLKAKNKNKINDGELSLAFSEGQERKMPVFFLSTGNLTKKAEQLAKDRFKGLVFKNI